MKKLTKFTIHTTEEGQRIGYTYSVIDEDGRPIDRNIQKNFIVVDKEIQSHIDAIKMYIDERINAE